MKIIIDRFEGDFAVVELENRAHVDMPKALIPKGAKEGDCLSITVDKQETASREKTIKTRMEDLFED